VTRKLNILVVILMLALSACASAPKNTYVHDMPLAPLNLKNANFGAYPSEVAYILKAWGEGLLKDPESARYSNISKPRKEYIYENRAPVYGYSVCATVNAKNSYGGYVGNKRHWFFIRDGKVLRSKDLEEHFEGPAYLYVPTTLISINHYVNCSDGNINGD
jgi:hypothetical protein